MTEDRPFGSISDELSDEAVELLRESIKFDTSNPPGRETPLAEHYARYLQDAGIEPTVIESAPGRGNVIGRVSGDGSARPLLLSAHLDVVPANPAEWTHPPFAAEEHDGYIWGRGAVDMKAMAAMSAVVMKALARARSGLKRDIIFAGVADEEAGGTYGAGFLADKHPELIEAEYGLTEVGGFTMPFPGRTLIPVQVAEKGMEWVRLRVKGRPGHGSLPHEDNAVLKLAQRLEGFRKPLRFRPTEVARRFVRELGAAQGVSQRILSTLLTTSGLGARMLPAVPEERRRPVRAMLCDLATPTRLEAGVGNNVIPGEACATLDARYLPGTSRDEVLRMIRERAGTDVEVEPLGGMGPLTMPFPTPLLDTIQSVMTRHLPESVVVPYLMPGFTDAKHYVKLGMTVYGYAPVSLARDEPFASLYHAPDERISVAGFRRGLQWLHDVVREFAT